MQALTDFFAMGGHAAFIWPAFAIAAVVLIGLLAASVRGLRGSEADLRLLRHHQRGQTDGGEPGRSA